MSQSSLKQQDIVISSLLTRKYYKNIAPFYFLIRATNSILHTSNQTLLRDILYLSRTGEETENFELAF